MFSFHLTLDFSIIPKTKIYHHESHITPNKQHAQFQHGIDLSIINNNILPADTSDHRSSACYNLRPSTNPTYNETELKNNNFTLHINAVDQVLLKKPPTSPWDYNNRFNFLFNQM